MDKYQEISKKSELIEYIESGCKPKSAWRIGTEHEKFLYTEGDHKRVAYFGDNGIQELLLKMQARTNWTPMNEGDYIIGLSGPNGDSITLEPGGQFELSGAPLHNLHETCSETSNHLHLMLDLCKTMGIKMFGLGHDPLYEPDDIEWMPKGRYRIMRRYMPTKGKRGTEMMTMTCTVQVNLDYASEADMVKKFRTSLALQPIISALFANSPIMKGKVTGFQTERCAVWQDTDPDRTGFPSCVFEDGFGFERWTDYLLSVPMYFVYDHGEYLDATGNYFGDFLSGNIKKFANRPAILKDWDDHLTVAFTEVRLKRYLEMRGADAGSWGHLCALPAIFTGLLYDTEALDAAHDIMKNWQLNEMIALSRNVPKTGLRTEFRHLKVLDIAKEVVKIAEHGLNKRAKDSIVGHKEANFLAPLVDIVESGLSPADRLLASLNGEHKGNLQSLIKSLSY